jgi:hypothetical protein
MGKEALRDRPTDGLGDEVTDAMIDAGVRMLVNRDDEMDDLVLRSFTRELLSDALKARGAS